MRRYRIVASVEPPLFYFKTESSCFGIQKYSGSNPEGTYSPIKPKTEGQGAFKKKMIYRLHWVSTSRTTPIGVQVSIRQPFCRRHTARYCLPQEMFHLGRGLQLPYMALKARNTQFYGPFMCEALLGCSEKIVTGVKP